MAAIGRDGDGQFRAQRNSRPKNPTGDVWSTPAGVRLRKLSRKDIHFLRWRVALRRAQMLWPSALQQLCQRDEPADPHHLEMRQRFRTWTYPSESRTTPPSQALLARAAERRARTPRLLSLFRAWPRVLPTVATVTLRIDFLFWGLGLGVSDLRSHVKIILADRKTSSNWSFAILRLFS